MTAKSIEQRAWLNAMVGGISFLIALGQTVALVPILLRQWGTGNYGLWLTLMAGFNLLQTLDLGHQNYVGNQLNIQYHTDLEQFRRTLGSSLQIAGLLGLLEIGLCLTLLASGTLHAFLGVPQALFAKHQLGLGLLLLMSMWFTFGSVGGIVVRIMTPTGLLYQSQWLGILMRLSQFLSIVAVALAGGSILSACLCFALTQSAVALYVFWYLRARLPQFYPWWRGGSWSEGWRALKKSLVLTGNSIGGQLSNNGLLILISALFSSAVIPSFTTLRTLTNTAGAVTGILITALLPDLIRFHATRDAEKLANVLYVNWFLAGICVNFGIVLVLPLIEPVYRIWTKGYLAFNPALFFLLAVAISLANFGAGLTLYLAGINDLRSQITMTLARTGLLFLVGYLLSAPCGILSIGIGSVAAELAASVALPVLFANRRLAAFSRRLGTRQLALAIMPPSLLLFAGGLVSIYHRPMGVVTAVMLPALCAIYYVNWKELNMDIRQRICLLVTAALRKCYPADCKA